VSLSRMKNVNTFQANPGLPCWYKRGSHLMSLTEMERFSASSSPQTAICIINWSIYYLERWSMNGNDWKWSGKWHEFILVMFEIEMAGYFQYYFLYQQLWLMNWHMIKTLELSCKLFSSFIALLFQFNPSKQIQLDDRFSRVFQQQRCSI
jgi:hypothetical protein